MISKKNINRLTIVAIIILVLIIIVSYLFFASLSRLRSKEWSDRHVFQIINKLYNHKQYDSVLIAGNYLLENDHNSFLLFVKLSHSYYKKGDINNAIRYLEKTLSAKYMFVEPDDHGKLADKISSHYQLYELYHKTGNSVQSEAHLKKANDHLKTYLGGNYSRQSVEKFFQFSTIGKLDKSN